MRFALLCLITLLSFSTISCKKDSSINPHENVELKEEKIFNMAYGEHPRNKMDVFLPKGRSQNTVVAVILHGGTWIEGDKSDMRFIQEELLKQNIASVSMNYRYADFETHYDHLMADVGKALETVKENSSDWGIRSQKYSLLGYSAGAHLAMLYGYGFKKTNEIQTVVSVAGPSDLKTLSQDALHNVMLASVLVGVNPLEFFTHSRTTEASPVYHINSTLPTLFIHGDQDEVVPFNQSVKMQSILNDKGVKNKLVILEGNGHDVTANPINLLKVLNQSIIWLRDEGK